MYYENKSKDYIQQLVVYLRKNLAKGYTLESLKVSLLNQGYSRISIENAIDLVHQQLAAEAPPMKEKPMITYKAFPEIEEKPNFFKKFWRKLSDWF